MNFLDAIKAAKEKAIQPGPLPKIYRQSWRKELEVNIYWQINPYNNQITYITPTTKQGTPNLSFDNYLAEDWKIVESIVSPDKEADINEKEHLTKEQLLELYTHAGEIIEKQTQRIKELENVFKENNELTKENNKLEQTIKSIYTQYQKLFSGVVDHNLGIARIFADVEFIA